MKNIAFVTQSLYGGGQERVTANLVNSLCRKYDYKVYVVSGKQSEKDYDLSNEVIRHCIITGNIVKDSLKLREFLRDYKIDIAVGMGMYGNFISCLSNFFQKTRIIISERNDPFHDRISKKSKLFRFLFYRLANGYVFQTEGARLFYSKSIQSRGVIIPNPVRNDLPHKSNVNNKEIVAIGRLYPQKNYKNLIEAFSIVEKKHPEYILRIFGEGELEIELKTLCKSLGIDSKVFFEGFCSNVHQQIIDSEIFVMSSDFEGMPNALMEAMAMGFPCVSTDCPCGGPKDLIENNVNGLLVPVNNSSILANEIIRLIDNLKLKEIISNNSLNIRNIFSLQKITLRWEELFENIMKGF